MLHRVRVIEMCKNCLQDYVFKNVNDCFRTIKYDLCLEKENRLPFDNYH